MTAERPALLVALSRYPRALETGSAILIHHNLVALARRWAIHLLCRGEPVRPGEGAQGDVAPGDVLAAACARVEFTGRERSFVPKPLRAPLRALAGPPPSIAGLRSKAMRRRVEALLSGGRFPAMLVYDLGSVQYVPAAFAARTVACIEDPQALRLERMADLPVWTPREAARMRGAARRMRRYEKRVLPPLGRVVLLSEADARDMAAADGHLNLGTATYPVGTPATASPASAPPAMTSPGTAPPATAPTDAPRRADEVVFSGNMYHPANVDAALWLLEAILPRLLEQHPAATLGIVGARPDPRIVAAARRFGDRVRVTGRVPDVAEHVRRARVGVCPVRLAIGVQTKVVEALTLGTPVVSTSAGNRGVGAVPGESIQVEDDAAGFAGRVAALLRGEDWERLSQNGRRHALDRFTPARSAAELESHLEAVRSGGA